jgi:hypothetical protein
MRCCSYWSRLIIRMCCRELRLGAVREVLSERRLHVCLRDPAGVGLGLGFRLRLGFGPRSRAPSGTLQATGAVPAEVITDRAPTYPRVLDETWPVAWHHTERYANNRVEADHAQLKGRLRPMRGIKTLTVTFSLVIAAQLAWCSSTP